MHSKVAFALRALVVHACTIAGVQAAQVAEDEAFCISVGVVCAACNSISKMKPLPGKHTQNLDPCTDNSPPQDLQGARTSKNCAYRTSTCVYGQCSDYDECASCYQQCEHGTCWRRWANDSHSYGIADDKTQKVGMTLYESIVETGAIGHKGEHWK